MYKPRDGFGFAAYTIVVWVWQIMSTYYHKLFQKLG